MYYGRNVATKTIMVRRAFDCKEREKDHTILQIRLCTIKQRISIKELKYLRIFNSLKHSVNYCTLIRYVIFLMAYLNPMMSKLVRQ